MRQKNNQTILVVLMLLAFCIGVVFCVRGCIAVWDSNLPLWVKRCHKARHAALRKEPEHAKR